MEEGGAQEDVTLVEKAVALAAGEGEEEEGVDVDQGEPEEVQRSRRNSLLFDKDVHIDVDGDFNNGGADQQQSDEKANAMLKKKATPISNQ